MVVACLRSAPSSGVMRFLRKHHIAKHRPRCSQLDIVCRFTCLTNLLQLPQPSFAAATPMHPLPALGLFRSCALFWVSYDFSGDMPPSSSVQVPVRAISSLEQCMVVACFRSAPSSGVMRFVRKHHIAKHRSRCNQLDIVC